MLNIRSRHLQDSILDIAYYLHKNNLLWGDPVKGNTELNGKSQLLLLCYLL